MNSGLAVTLLILSLAVAIGIVAALRQPIARLFGRVPKTVWVILLPLVIIFMIYLVNFLVRDFKGGIPGSTGTEAPEPTQSGTEDIEVAADTVLLQGGAVFIKGKQAGTGELDKYLDYYVDNNIPVKIVDDYATAAVFHEVEDICESKGVNYSVTMIE